MRLLALHVVFTLPGHPEFIWGTMEHSTGTPDTRPLTATATSAPIHSARGKPDPQDPENRTDPTVISMDAAPALHAGTTAQAGNQAIAESSA